MSEAKPTPLVANGWTIFAHPLFLGQLEALTRQVGALKRKNPIGYGKKNATKRLAAIAKLAFAVIPQDPARPEYRQGISLGDEHKHWFRAKFFQQYRLFFRYHAPSKVIVYAWVNDEDTKRAYENSDDAYRVFRKMLEGGHPPDDWECLLAGARAESGRLHGKRRIGISGQIRRLRASARVRTRLKLALGVSNGNASASGLRRIDEIQCISHKKESTMATTTMVHVRIDEQVKAQATETLAAMGLSVSDAVRVFLMRVAAEKQLPFALKVPNAKTCVAMVEADEIAHKRRARFGTAAELYDDLEKNGGK